MGYLPLIRHAASLEELQYLLIQKKRKYMTLADVATLSPAVKLY